MKLKVTLVGIISSHHSLGPQGKIFFSCFAYDTGSFAATIISLAVIILWVQAGPILHLQSTELGAAAVGGISSRL